MSEESLGLLTVTMAHIINGQLFKVNHQFEYTAKSTLMGCCVCDGEPRVPIIVYTVFVDGMEYQLEEKNIVETDVPIPAESQDFNTARRDQYRDPAGAQAKADFDGIRVNNDAARIFVHASRIQPKDVFKH